MAEQNDNTSTLAFPCTFPIKAIGLASTEFEIEVLNIFTKHVAQLSEDALKYHSSKNNKYLSITVTIEAHSQTQLDNIYQDLSNNPLVLLAL